MITSVDARLCASCGCGRSDVLYPPSPAPPPRSPFCRPFELAFPTFAPPFTTPIGVFFAPLLGGVDPSRSRAAEFAAFDARLRGGSPDLSSHTHFYDSDYTVHHRERYAVFVHMLSARTEATECVNDENKRGRMLADGATAIYGGGGGQYESVFPLLNWTLLPGTTEVQHAAVDAESAEHECLTIRAGDVHNPFVGGLSEGGVGVSAMDFARADNLLGSHPATGADGGAHRACTNTTDPKAGYHCDIAQSTNVGNSVALSAAACETACCDHPTCSCWTWTTFERASASPCKLGQPCCWLKESTAPLTPAANCTGGHVNLPPPGKRRTSVAWSDGLRFEPRSRPVPEPSQTASAVAWASISSLTLADSRGLR